MGISDIRSVENRSTDVQAFTSSADVDYTKIVIIDDDPMTLRLLQAQLKGLGHSIVTAENPAHGLDAIDEDTAVVILDLRMPDIDGFQCLQYIRKHHGDVQVLVLTGSQDAEDAVNVMRAGAFHFISKPCDSLSLKRYVLEGIEAFRAARQSSNSTIPAFECDFPASSGAIDSTSFLHQQVDRVAAVESTVFIGGESGTGKSTIAKLIHEKSTRGSGPFVTVNCASLPRELLTSELFGHTKGSFTGADRDRAGHAEVANGGTLFLDEIGDLPLELQPKLLTFLQDRTFQRLGSSTVQKADVRLIVATHRDLATMCMESEFRQDLYFRLMVLQIEVPPLRERLAELPMMAGSILARLSKRMGIREKKLSQAAVELLLKHTWPGNIRELENVLERTTAFSSDDILQPHDLVLYNGQLDRRNERRVTNTSNSIALSVGKGNEFLSIPPSQSEIKTPAAYPESDSVYTPAQPWQSPDRRQEQSAQAEPILAGRSLKEIERIAILQTLKANDGNKAKTARVLGISEKSIYNKMRRHSIDWQNLLQSSQPNEESNATVEDMHDDAN